jgi:hypothetical protein
MGSYRALSSTLGCSGGVMTTSSSASVDVAPKMKLSRQEEIMRTLVALASAGLLLSMGLSCGGDDNQDP